MTVLRSSSEVREAASPAGLCVFEINQVVVGVMISVYGWSSFYLQNSVCAMKLHLVAQIKKNNFKNHPKNTKDCF